MNTTILNPISPDNMLGLLTQQKDSFVHLAEFIKTKDIKPSTVFLPQTLKLIDLEFTTKEDLILDCINYLDVVKIYSISVYGDEECYFEAIKRTISKNRTVRNANAEILSRETLDDFMFTSEEDCNQFLENNKLLVAIYLYSLVAFIFNTEG